MCGSNKSEQYLPDLSLLIFHRAVMNCKLNRMNSTIHFPLFRDNPKADERNDSGRLPFIHRGYSKSISRWKEINQLFIDHYPLPTEERSIKAVDSYFSEKERRVSAPYGYCQFLQSVDIVSAKLDEVVTEYPDFWNRLPTGYWSDGAETYDKAIEFVDFISGLDSLWMQSVEDIYLAAGNSKVRKSITVKCGEQTLRTDAFWKDVIVGGIMNEANRWFDEAGIPIDTWDMNPKQAKKTIREIKSRKVTMDGENTQAYIVGKLTGMLNWPGTNAGNTNADSSEFIMRFLDICGLDKEHRIEHLDRFFQEAEKDSNGRPLNKSSYFGERREISELIRRLNLNYKSMSGI